MSSRAFEERSEWEAASQFSRWTFCVANNMISRGMTEPLKTSDDLMRLSSDDRSAPLVITIERVYAKTKPALALPRLLAALIIAHPTECFIVSFWSIVESAVRVASPAMIRFILLALATPGAAGRRDSFMFAGILSALNIAQTFVHHVLFFYSMRLGWRWKVGATGMIFNKLFRLQGGQMANADMGTGKLVNLISNDVTKFEECAVFIAFTWCSILDLIAILIILIYELNVAAGFSGVGIIILFIPVQVQLAKQFARIRTRTAHQTDQRVRHISEIIDGMATVKSYAWEIPFFSLLASFRAKEVECISASLNLRAINLALHYASPPVAAFGTFAVFWATGGQLTLPIVFSTLSLLLCLRTSIGRNWTRGIETTSEAVASAQRIERFLDLPEDETTTRQGVDMSERGGAVASVGSGVGGIDPNISVGIEIGAVSEDPASTFSADRRLLASTPAEEEEELNAPSHDHGGNESQLRPVALVRIPKSSYYYGEDATKAVLRDVQLEVDRGELLMIVGPVGAGKSSILNVVLGELKQVPEHSSISGKKSVSLRMRIAHGLRLAYCAQRPWILASSVRSNVTLAGSHTVRPRDEDYKKPSFVDDDMYKLAVESCRIVADMEQWPDYDDTEIGERGISISGGQKARISLARAVYSDADLYVLDDPLSTVDAHVGQALFFECIISALRDRGKGIILATHQLQYLKHADKVLVLDKDGNQQFYGTYADLQLHPDVISMVGSSNSLSTSVKPSTSTTADLSNAVALAVAPEPEVKLPVEEDLQQNSSPSKRTVKDQGAKAVLSYDPSRRLTKGAPSKKLAEPTTQPEGNAETTMSLVPIATVKQGMVSERSGPSKVILAEDRIEGNVSFSLWWKYFKAGGALLSLFVMSFAFFSQGILMINDYWPRWWASASFGHPNGSMYVWVLGCLTAVCIIVGFYRAHVWFQFSVKASSNMHERALWAVLHSPQYFFVANPTGRILNRFAKDQSLADEAFPFTLFDAYCTSLFCLSALLLVCISIPWLILIMPPLLYLFNVVRGKYLRSAIEIKRIEAVSRSPIYADFSATLEGLSTLRAYKLEAPATVSFHRQLDRNSRAWFAFLMVSRWLGFRLDLESAIVLVCISFVAVSLRGTIDIGLIGFAIVYSLSLSGLLQWTVRQTAEVESQMTSIERINTYAELPPEPGYSSTLAKYLEGQEPTVFAGRDDRPVPVVTLKKGDEATSKVAQGAGAGAVEIRNITVRYRDDLEPVITDMSLFIPAGSKVGFCGRTGCGKSSTLLALLRLNIISSGDVFIDGESLLSMDLETARGMISVIPQDPHLFSGTIRFNLDPFNRYSDQEIWSALEDSHIKEYISSDSLGLSKLVEEGGKNFSVGQRQLLSLARAILRRCKVVLMDEVTASIDYATDRLIQETIRSSDALRSSTIITVAHRLRTIADSDMVVVMGPGGAVAEKGKPADLLAREDSLFRDLAEESNEIEEIMAIAFGNKTNE